MKLKIFPKTIMIVAAVALLPLFVSLFIAYRITEKAVADHALVELDAIAQTQEHRVHDGIDRLQERLKLIRSRTPMLIALEKYYQAGDKANLDVVISALSGAQSAIEDISSISILNLNGMVVLSTDRNLSGRDFSQEDYFVRGKSDFFYDSFGFDSKGETILHLSCPIEYKGRMLGVLVVESLASVITELTGDYTGLGDTGESLLARKDHNGDALYIVPLRFDPKAALKRTVHKTETDKPIIQALLKQEKVLQDAVDYRGEPVFAATRHIKDTGWGLVVKMDRAEVLKPLIYVRNLFIALVVFTALFVVISAYFASRHFVNPIIQLADLAKMISSGRNDLLSYSRVTTRGKEFIKIDCNVVIRHVLQDLDMAIKDSNASVTFGELPFIMADQSQIAQLFQNLIGNAVKYHGEQDPKVQVAAEKRDGMWQFSITDNGIGIAPEFFERIFVLFQRLHTRTEYSGTGIGLAVCKKIVERHGGKIWVESEPEKGSTFFFTIPATEVQDNA